MEIKLKQGEPVGRAVRRRKQKLEREQALKKPRERRRFEAPSAKGRADEGDPDFLRDFPKVQMKFARILDESGGTFRLEYDDTLGHKQNNRLDAITYEQALREARSYLGIGDDARDPEGTEWDIE